jgi:RNA recognition motif-containing protein
VGNLSFNTGEARLREFFAEAGEILHVSIPTDRENGRPRGFAFVEFQSAEGARAAIALLDGRELDGRKLRLSEADRARKSAPRPRPQPDEDLDFRVRHGLEEGWDLERGGDAGRGKGRDGWRPLRGTKRSL